MQSLDPNGTQKYSVNSDIDNLVHIATQLSNQETLQYDAKFSVKIAHTSQPDTAVDAICMYEQNSPDKSKAKLPILRLKPLLDLDRLNELSDEAMQNFQRNQLIDSRSHTPSIEMLLHAFLPAKFIFQIHSNAISSILNQPNPKNITAKVYAKTMGIVPYIKPGFTLAKKALEIYIENPDIEGLILLNRGIVILGESAEIAYDRMIEVISKAKYYIKENSTRSHSTAPQRQVTLSAENIAPVIRGNCFYNKKRMIVTYRNNELIQKYINGERLQHYSQCGVTTPNHILITKNKPLIVHAGKSMTDFKNNLKRAISDYKDAYNRYFVKYNSLRAQPKTKLDPIPRVILVPQVGLFAVGESSTNTDIIANVAEDTMQTVLDAEAIGRYTPLSEEELFEVEYNSIEQARILKSTEKSMERKVVVITEASGTIGKATAMAFAKHGAEIVLLDNNLTTCKKIAKAIGGNTLALQCNLTNEKDIEVAFKIICTTFGGVDIAILNSNEIFSGKIASISSEQLRKSFETNFFSQQNVARIATNIMLEQSTGGSLLFSVSKQSINPAHELGAYNIPKAATLALIRQYAIDYAAYGIHASAINADKIYNTPLSNEAIKIRAEARGISTSEYLKNKVLQQETSADNMAQVFVHQALVQKTMIAASNI